jgi:hypothetical protein
MWKVLFGYRISEWTQMSILELFGYRNDSFQSDIFSSDIGITDVNVGCRISPTLRSMSMPTYAYYTLDFSGTWLALHWWNYLTWWYTCMKNKRFLSINQANIALPQEYGFWMICFNSWNGFDIQFFYNSALTPCPSPWWLGVRKMN